MIDWEARFKALEKENTELKKEVEIVIWNLAGCSTFALGYGLDEEFSKEMARPALTDVLKLALRARKLEAVARAAERFLAHGDDVEPDPYDELDKAVSALTPEEK